ncbi:MAG: Eco29kI family restriction endonuclease [Xanthobacteraceae bacterium]|nr:Eco29kI family restriction endonuclease [Xanthobacteraceae bacterium]
MAKAPSSPADVLVAKLRKDLSDLASQARSAELSPNGRKKLNLEIARAAGDLNDLLAELDPVKRPRAVFDPGNPRTIGFFIALAITAQPRQPLGSLPEFYGSGVYAIYYNGDYPLYAPLSRTETPIYVGQAAPGNDNAQTPVEQGLRLCARLNEHRKNIVRASSLNIEDFECRALVVQTGWETGAEDYLIRLFRPIWNSETKLVFGLGKHGDSAETRKNKRSPWDTLHEGREWAGAGTIVDAKSPERIEEELRTHFERRPVYRTVEEVLSGFVESLRQT